MNATRRSRDSGVQLGATKSKGFKPCDGSYLRKNVRILGKEIVQNYQHKRDILFTIIMQPSNNSNAS